MFPHKSFSVLAVRGGEGGGVGLISQLEAVQLYLDESESRRINWQGLTRPEGESGIIEA